MRSIAAVFPSLDDGARAVERATPLVGRDCVSLLLPGQSDVAEKVPTTEDMPPVGGPIVGTLAGVLGAGAALAIPGVGAITAFGAAAAAAFGAAAGYAGWKIGQTADLQTFPGPSIDDLHLYEDALEQGRTVVIGLARDAAQYDELERIFRVSGAESIDAARERWWLGLRDAEEEHYRTRGGDFGADEPAFRAGFEAALHPGCRGRALDDCRDALSARLRGQAELPAFQGGWERGREYLRRRGASGAGDGDVDEASKDSFPASDPPSTGSGRTGSPVR